VPQSAEIYLEINNPQKFIDIAKKTTVYGNINSSAAWNNFLSAPSMQRIFNYLYIIEVKSKNMINADNIGSFVTNFIGISIHKDGSILVIAEIDLKTKIGLSILSSFKSDSVIEKNKIEEAGEKKEASGNQTADNNNTDAGEGQNEKPVNIYNDVYSEDSIKYSNVRIYRFQTNNGFAYVALLDRLLVFSDSLDTIKQALKLASSNGGDSLGAEKGFNKANKEFDDGDALLFMRSNNFEPLSFLLNDIAVIWKIESDTLTGDIFNIGKDYEKKEKTEAAVQSAPIDVIPVNDNAVMISSGIFTIKQFSDAVGNLDDKEWIAFKKGFADLNKAVKLEKYMSSGEGLSVCLKELTVKNGVIFPVLSAVMDNVKEDGSIIDEFYNKNKFNQSKAIYQGIEYTAYNSSESLTNPAYLYRNKKAYFTMTTQDMESYISAGNGNKPVVKDVVKESMGKFSDAPLQIVIDFQKTSSVIQKYFYYGAGKTDVYSAKTIDNDIVSLFEPFKNVNYVIMSYGIDEYYSGKILVK